MLLRVDNREPAALKNLFCNVEFGNLAAGDFELVQDGRVVLIIERKEIADLCASLTDGRFDDQKAKLSAASVASSCAVAYLIEGDFQNHEKQAAIETVIMTSRFRDGFFVLQTADFNDTYTTVMRLVELYQRGKMQPLTEDEQHRRFIASRAAHRGGSQFSRQDQWWVVSLAQIPGIGPTAARVIVAQYPTVRSLLAAYSACDSIKKRRELLQDLKATGKRRLGPKASELVWRTVVGDGDDRPPRKPRAATSKRTWTPKQQQDEVVCLFVDDE